MAVSRIVVCGDLDVPDRRSCATRSLTSEPSPTAHTDPVAVGRLLPHGVDKDGG